MRARHVTAGPHLPYGARQSRSRRFPSACVMRALVTIISLVAASAATSIASAGPAARGHRVHAFGRLHVRPTILDVAER